MRKTRATLVLNLIMFAYLFWILNLLLRSLKQNMVNFLLLDVNCFFSFHIEGGSKFLWTMQKWKSTEVLKDLGISAVILYNSSDIPRHLSSNSDFQAFTRMRASWHKSLSARRTLHLDCFGFSCFTGTCYEKCLLKNL